MKKVLATTMILFCIFLCSCTNTAQNNDYKYSRIIVTDSERYSQIFHYYLGDYDNLQNTLDKIVERYNKTYDNEDLYKICHIIGYSDCFENGNSIIIAYYNKFFEEIENNKDFDKKTKASQKTFACVFVTAMYNSGKQNEAIEFFNKYLATINDASEKVNFSFDCFQNIYGSSIEPNHNIFTVFLNTAKELEEKYYQKVEYMDKARIYQIISGCYEKLGDEQASKEYKEKARQVIKDWTDEFSEN